MFKIDQFSSSDCGTIVNLMAKKPTLKQIQAIRCPTFGAGSGEKCELTTGQPRGRGRLIAGD